ASALDGDGTPTDGRDAHGYGAAVAAQLAVLEEACPDRELREEQHDREQDPRHPPPAQFEPLPCGQACEGHKAASAGGSGGMDGGTASASPVTSRKYSSSVACTGFISAT